jgi:hypothetical protein
MNGSQLFATIASSVSAIGVVASMLFIAWQVREGAHQRRISNAIAGSSGLRSCLEFLQSVERVFIDKPELRPYFHDGKRCPRDGDTRQLVETVANMYADALEVGLLTNQKIQATDSEDDWTDYCTYMLGMSPTLALIVCAHPKWWPSLAVICDEQKILPASTEQPGTSR